MTAIRSASRSASSMKWVTRTTVTPRSRTSSIRSQVSRRACGSSPVVSSSRIAIRGLPTSASAIDSRCFWPPDSLPKAVLRCVVRPRSSMSRSPVGRVLVERRVQVERLPDAELIGQLALLELDADLLAQSCVGRGAGRGRGPGSCPSRGSAGRRWTRRWWSCRRRSGRGWRRSRPPRRRRRHRRRPRGRRSA